MDNNNFKNILLYAAEKAHISELVNKVKSLDIRKKACICAAAVVVLVLIIVGAKGCGGEKYRSVKFEEHNGDVTLIRDGGHQDIVEGEILIPEDEVTTGYNASALLLVDADKHIEVDEQTSFTISATGNAKKGLVKIDLLYGESLYTIDNKLSKNSSFEVTTPNSTLSVRGTTFRVNYDKKYNITDIEVIEGTVWVQAGEDEIILEAGDYLSVWNDEYKQYPNGTKPSDKKNNYQDVAKSDNNNDSDSGNKGGSGDWKEDYKAILDDPYSFLSDNESLDYSSSGLKYQYSLIDIYGDSVPELILYVYGDFGGNGRYFPFYVTTYEAGEGCVYLCTEYMEVSSSIGVINGTPVMSSISNGTGDWSMYSLGISKGSLSLGDKVQSGNSSTISTMWSDAEAVAEYTDLNDTSIFDNF